MTDQPTLFAGPEPLIPTSPEPVTAGERLRRRQAARIGQGLHPLSYDGAIIRLHPDAGRPTSKAEVAVDAPTCGSCVHRVLEGGHARSFPKCYFGRTIVPLPEGHPGRRFGAKVSIRQPRATSGQASDVRAWWPACVDHQPRATS